MMSWESLFGKLMLFSAIICLSLFVFKHDADATIVLSLAGHRDGLGTGISLGAPVATAYSLNTPSDGDFDQRKTTRLQWTHSYDLPLILEEGMESGKRV
jgi:hypothetical protein